MSDEIDVEFLTLDMRDQGKLAEVRFKVTLYLPDDKELSAIDTELHDDLDRKSIEVVEVVKLDSLIKDFDGVVNQAAGQLQECLSMLAKRLANEGRLLGRDQEVPSRQTGQPMKLKRDIWSLFPCAHRAMLDVV